MTSNLSCERNSTFHSQSLSSFEYSQQLSLEWKAYQAQSSCPAMLWRMEGAPSMVRSLHMQKCTAGPPGRGCRMWWCCQRHKHDIETISEGELYNSISSDPSAIRSNAEGMLSSMFFDSGVTVSGYVLCECRLSIFLAHESAYGTEEHYEQFRYSAQTDDR